MKRLLAFSALLLVALAPAAYASNPNHDDGCHGANNVPCRPDPQPTHGNDCQNSDDHSCDVTTTTTTSTAPITTTTRPTAITILTVPTVLLSPTSTTTSSPSVASIPETGSTIDSSPSPSVSVWTVPAATSPAQLPATGAGGTLYLLAIGLVLTMFGSAAWLAGRA